jgi:hypothetical protein
VGLELTVNRWGALIYRRPVKGVQLGITEAIREQVIAEDLELLKVS